MSRHKNFDAALAENDQEPLRFTLAGHDFECLPEVPVAPLLRLAARSGREGPDAILAFGEFLEAIVLREQRDAMHAAFEEVGYGRLRDVIKWLIEEMTAAPLANLSSSPPSPLTNGAPSKVVSLNPIDDRLA